LLPSGNGWRLGNPLDPAIDLVVDNADRHDWLSTFKSAAAAGTAWVSGAVARRRQQLTDFDRFVALKALSKPKDIPT